MFCIWAFVPFVAAEMLTPRVVLDIFLLKNYLSSTSYLARCCVQTYSFHYSHRQKTNTLWTAVNKICRSSFQMEKFCLFSKLGPHFVPFSLNLLKTFRINKKLFYPLYDEHYYPSILRTLYGDRALFLLLEIEQFKVEYFNGKQKHSSQKPINCWYDRNYD